MVILGESGCGKISLARAILRLLPRNVQTYAGKVRLNDSELMDLGDEEFRRNVRAVDGVSFDLSFGEAIGVVGESGSGKSTLMKTILGLYQPSKGDIVFDGTTLGDLGRREMRAYRSQVGFVQQDPYGALPPFMNVARILEEPLRVNRVKGGAERAKRIREVMQEVKMSPVDEFLPKFPHMLSGGQQQRVVIVLGFVLVLLGFVAPLLMVIRVIEPSFALSFVSHGASVGGLFLGLFGVVSYNRARRD